ncbi:hypothetical protein TWF225_010377 [Orbilia oligospora]|uniref:Uncharacterized protein n=1 Tax=Orbilia oligospora TaxID=2813651 RepID=A0A8H2DV71_ORBOL|nr:hypothetical protein TWF225_010377 [Orbilia oligospora]KAF3250505.1 hypothetical protein TWF217_008547 [Orbilia oligospora]TGJ65453.1 hypothetical protein EYR41_009418 [Orbilia oligospora]
MSAVCKEYVGGDVCVKTLTQARPVGLVWSLTDLILSPSRRREDKGNSMASWPWMSANQPLSSSDANIKPRDTINYC